VSPAPSPYRRIWWIGLLLLVLTVAGFAVLAVVGDDREPPPPLLERRPLPAEGLADSIGVSTHFNYTDTTYVRRDELIARLREAGIRHVRAPMPTPPEGPLADALRAIRAAGLRLTFTTGDPAVDPARGVADALAVGSGAIVAFEGPNELDLSGDPSWPAKLRDYMPRLITAAGALAPGIPVIGPSFGRPGSPRIAGSLPGMVNLHPYPGGKPPEGVFGEALQEVAERRAAGVVFTETGYHNALNDAEAQPPVPEDVAGVYVPRLLATAYGAGIRRTFLYELADERPEPALSDPEEHFGLLRTDLSAKPAFSAIKTLTAALRASPGRGVRDGTLRWSVEAPDDVEVQRLTLVRRDGSHVVALWRPVSVWDVERLRRVEVPARRVKLRFGRIARDVAVWRPSASSAPVLRRGLASAMSLDLGADLVLVSLR
jgi:hypothetical protein